MNENSRSLTKNSTPARRVFKNRLSVLLCVIAQLFLINKEDRVYDSNPDATPTNSQIAW